ncbi:MAG: GNVR domain-containing protein [Hyphomicrobium sp.]|nr:GNVR domain-containing protein [Hyphomicrobium sp.]
MTQQAQQSAEGTGGAFSLERAVSAVKRRLPIVAIVTGLVVGLVAATVMLLPNRYDAVATVQIDPRKKSISNLENVISDLRADSTTVDSEVEVIKSRSIVLKVIEILKLREDEEFSKPAPFQRLFETIRLGKFLSSTPAEPAKMQEKRLDSDPIGRIMGTPEPGMFMPERDEVAAAFDDRLRVARVRSTLLIEIRFSSRDPVMAARIANTIAEVYLAEQLNAKREASGLATELLEQKIRKLEGEIGDADRAIAHFKSDNNMFDAEGQPLSERQLTRTMEQLVMAQNATAQAEARLETARRMMTVSGGTDTIADVLDSNTIRILKENMVGSAKRRAELATRYGARHPEMQKVQAEFDEAERQLKAEVSRLVVKLDSDYREAAQRQRQLEVEVTTLKEKEATSKEASVKLMELQRNAATARQLIEALLTRYKQTSETQELQLPDARIVEQADVPLFPAAPKRKQMVLLAVLAGLVLGIAVALVLEFANRGVTTPEDVERSLEVAHLASLPVIVEPDAEFADPLRAIRLVLAEPRSLFAEVIRGVRREIDVRSRPGKARVILVASSLPGEGGELVSSNLAHHYALTGSRVLLVDGDLRRAPLTRRLAPQRFKGLLDILAQGDVVDQAILHDQATGLYFLPAMGPAPLDIHRPELLTSPQMVAAIERMRSVFDTIIIDAPPLLPVVDGRILADFADQIVFTMAWRRTPKQLAKRALSTLGLNHDKVAGVVVNSVASEALEDNYALGASLTLAAAGGSRRAA